MKYKILTPSGFSDFSGVRKKSSNSILKLTFSDNSVLECTPDHFVKTPNGFVLAEQLENWSEILTISDKKIHVVSKEQIYGEFFVYDPVGVENNSEYYTNSVVSHNCDFMGSSNTLISGKKLAVLSWDDPISQNATTKVYEKAKHGHNYVLVADTSRGSGLDFSAFVVFDITEYPYKTVATYRDNTISHLVYPQYIYEFAKAYNDAFVLVETNDIGQVISDILFYDYEYENMLLTQSKGRSGQVLGGGAGGTMPTFGLRTTTPVKRIGCVNLKSLVENDKLLITDYQILYELNRFVSKKSSFEAEEGCNDDMVMCCVLFAWLVHQDYFKDIANADIRQLLQSEQESIINDNLLPFGFIVTAADDYEDENPQGPLILDLY